MLKKLLIKLLLKEKSFKYSDLCAIWYFFAIIIYINILWSLNHKIF